MSRRIQITKKDVGHTVEFRGAEELLMGKIVHVANRVARVEYPYRDGQTYTTYIMVNDERITALHPARSAIDDRLAALAERSPEAYNLYERIMAKFERMNGERINDRMRHAAHEYATGLSTREGFWRENGFDPESA